MLAFENTLLYQEAIKVMQSDTPTDWSWSCEFIVGNISYTPFRLLHNDNNRDYNQNVCDDRQITVLFPSGTFLKNILPFIDDAIVTITRTPKHKVGSSKPVVPQIRRFRAIYLNSPLSHVKGTSPDNMNFDAADLSNLNEYKFQLMDLAFERLRTVSVGVNLNKVTMRDALRLVIGKESKRISVMAEEAIKGVDVYQPANTKVYDHIIVPDGVPLMALPAYLQKRCGGVYSSGIGFYLQAGIWYVYPEFDVTRYDTELRTLTILNVPSNKLPTVEHTYRTTANQVILLCTGEMRFFDDISDQQYNYGNGARFVDASKIMDNHGSYDGGKYTTKRSLNATEVSAWDNKTGVNNAMVSGGRITSNPFEEYSKLSRRNCQHVQLVWENSDESLLYPGMPLKFVYLKGSTQGEVKGTLCAVKTTTTGKGGTMVNSGYQTNSVLTLIIEAI